MNVRFLRLFFLFLAVMSVGFAAQAAETAAYVDMQKLMTESKAARHIQKQIEKYREDFLEELAEEEKTLNAARKELEDSQSLPQEQFSAKRQEFEVRFQEARTQAQMRKKELDVALATAMSDLRENAEKIVKAIADDRGYALVLNKQVVVFGRDAADITEEAMEKLNEKTPKIVLKVDG